MNDHADNQDLVSAPVSQKRKVVFVLGMHRSGTSAITGLLAKLGAAPPNDPMPATSDNIRGYWESVGVRNFNDGLLTALGSRWDDWRAVDAEKLEAPDRQAFSARAAQLLEDIFGGADFFVLKDPRICRIVPFWLRVAEESGLQQTAVIPIRSPLEVARSLEKRDGMPISHGIVLWLRHLLDSEAATRHIPRCFLTFDDLLADWRPLADRMSSQLKLDWPERPDAVSSEVDAYLGAELKRQHTDDASLRSNADILDWTYKAYMAVLALRDDPYALTILQSLTNIKAEFDQACGFFGPFVKGIETQVDSLVDARNRFAEANESLDKERNRLEEAQLASARQIGHLHEQISDLHEQISDLHEQINELRRVAERDRCLYEQRLAVQAAALGQVRRLDEATSAELSRLVAELTAVVASRDQILNSTFWSATGPLRAALGSVPTPLLRFGRRAAKALYWLATPWKIPARLRFVRDRRLAVAEAAPASTQAAAEASIDPNVRLYSPAGRAAALISSSPLFDATWYRSSYRDLAELPLDVALHYMEHGAAEGRDPGPHFSTHAYLAQNSDVSASRDNPLMHYILYGAGEGREIAPSTSDQPMNALAYDLWVRDHDTLSSHDHAAITRHVDRLDPRPLMSVVMPVFNPNEAYLRQAIESVRSQLYPDWELCIADDASTAPYVASLLADYERLDNRIKVVRRSSNGHICAATNSALDLATGAFVALMDHDDVIPPHALYEFVVRLDRHPDADLLYSDEDCIDADGRRYLPYFKTDWNPELLLGHNCVSHFGVYRRRLIEAVGRLRVGYEGSQDYDLALRVADASAPERIHHIPAILYHWRRSGAESFSETQLDKCIDAARRSVADHLARLDEPATVVANPQVPGWQRVCRRPPSPAPLVSLIVPTKDRSELLAKCADGILTRTAYAPLELLIVDHESEEPETRALLDDLSRDPRVRIIPHRGPFNYSAINNNAARQATGTYLGLLNNDIEIIGEEWLTEMVSIASLPAVGAVGAKLLYEDGRVQHAGVVLGVGGVANHFCHNAYKDDPCYFGRAVMTSDVSAVTGACMVIQKARFDEVGGFDPDNLAVAFNDVDLCLRLRERGYRNVFTPFAMLYHLESASRGADMAPEKAARFRAEVEYMQRKWGPVLEEDPFYNVNFSLQSANFKLSFPSRRTRPWQEELEGAASAGVREDA